MQQVSAQVRNLQRDFRGLNNVIENAPDGASIDQWERAIATVKGKTPKGRVISTAEIEKQLGLDKNRQLLNVARKDINQSQVLTELRQMQAIMRKGAGRVQGVIATNLEHFGKDLNNGIDAYFTKLSNKGKALYSYTGDLKQYTNRESVKFGARNDIRNMFSGKYAGLATLFNSRGGDVMGQLIDPKLMNKYFLSELQSVVEGLTGAKKEMATAFQKEITKALGRKGGRLVPKTLLKTAQNLAKNPAFQVTGADGGVDMKATEKKVMDFFKEFTLPQDLKLDKLRKMQMDKLLKLPQTQRLNLKKILSNLDRNVMQGIGDQGLTADYRKMTGVVTDLKSLQAKLHKRIEELEKTPEAEMTKTKMMYLSMLKQLSHDLKNPKTRGNLTGPKMGAAMQAAMDRAVTDVAENISTSQQELRILWDNFDRTFETANSKRMELLRKAVAKAKTAMTSDAAKGIGKALGLLLPAALAKLTMPSSVMAQGSDLLAAAQHGMQGWLAVGSMLTTYVGGWLVVNKLLPNLSRLRKSGILNAVVGKVTTMLDTLRQSLTGMLNAPPVQAVVKAVKSIPSAMGTVADRVTSWAASVAKSIKTFRGPLAAPYTESINPLTGNTSYRDVKTGRFAPADIGAAGNAYAALSGPQRMLAQIKNYAAQMKAAYAGAAGPVGIVPPGMVALNGMLNKATAAARKLGGAVRAVQLNPIGAAALRAAQGIGSLVQAAAKVAPALMSIGKIAAGVVAAGMGKITSAFNKVPAVMQRVAQTVRTVAQQFNQFRNTILQAVRSAQSITNTMFTRIGSGLTKISSVVDRVGKQFQTFGQRVKNGFQTASQSAATLYFLSSTMTQAGSKLTGFGRNQYQKANQFYQQYSGYEMAANRAAVAGDADFSQVQEFVFGMQRGAYGGKPVTMYNAEQIAQAAYYYQSAVGGNQLTGRLAQETTASLLGPILQMSAATQTDPEAYIKGVVQIAQEFGMQPGKNKEDASYLGTIANLVGYVANISTLEVTDILETFKYLGPQANMLAGGDKKAGMSDAMVMTYLASMSGMKGSMAGRGMSQIVTSLLDITQPGSTKADEIVQLLHLQLKQGQSAPQALKELFFDENNILKGGITGALNSIIEATSGRPQDLARVLSQIFPQNATRVGSAIVTQMTQDDAFNESIQALADGDYEKANYLYEKAVARTSSTVTSSVNMMKNAWFQFKVSVVDAVKGPIKQALELLSNVFFELGDTMRNNQFLSQLIVGLTSLAGIVATVLGSLLTMGGTLFMIQRSFIMAGGSVSLFFGIITTLIGGLFSLFPLFLLLGAIVAIVIGKFGTGADGIGKFVETLKSNFSDKLTAKLRSFSEITIRALELVSRAFYEFVNTILMGNNVGISFLATLLSKLFGDKAAMVMIGMLQKLSTNMKSFRKSVDSNVGGIVERISSLKNITAVFRGLGQAFALGSIDRETTAKINDFGKALGIDGFVLIVKQAATEIWTVLSTIVAYVKYFVGEIKKQFQSVQANMIGATDGSPFMKLLAIIRELINGIVGGFLGALIAAAAAVAWLTRQLSGMGQGNDGILQTIENVTGLTVTVEKLGYVMGAVFGAMAAGRLLMMIKPIGQLVIGFTKIAVTAAQVGVGIAKTVVALVLQAAQLALNIAMTLAQAVAWAVATGAMLIATGAGMLLSSVLGFIVGLLLIIVGVVLIAAAAIVVLAVGILALVGITDGIGAALETAKAFMLGFIEAGKRVAELVTGMYQWAMSMVTAAVGTADLRELMFQLGEALAFIIGLPVAGVFIALVAAFGFVYQAIQFVIPYLQRFWAYLSNGGQSSIISQTLAGVGKAFSVIAGLIAAAAPMVSRALQVVWTGFEMLVRGVIRAISVMNQIGVFAMIASLFRMLASAVMLVVTILFQFAKVVIAAFAGLFRGMGAIAPMRRVFQQLVGVFKSVFDSIARLGAAIGRLVTAIAPLIQVLAFVGGYIIGVVVGVAIQLFVSALKFLGDILTWLIDALTMVIEYIASFAEAIGNGDIMQAFKLLYNFLIEIAALLIDAVLSAIVGVFDMVLGTISTLVGWIGSAISLFSDTAGNAVKGVAESIDGLRSSIGETKDAMVAGFKTSLQVDIEPQYQPGGGGDEGDGEAKSRSYTKNELNRKMDKSQQNTMVFYTIDEESASFITGAEMKPIYVDILGPDGKPISEMQFSGTYRVTDTATEGTEQAGGAKNDNVDLTGTITRDENGDYIFIDDQGKIDTTKGMGGYVPSSPYELRMYQIDQAEAAAKNATVENNGGFIGGIFEDLRTKATEVFGESETLQSIFGVAGVDVTSLRDSDMGTQLTTAQLRSMQAEVAASPTASKLLGPLLDSMVGQSEEYDALYYERERLTAARQAGYIDEATYQIAYADITTRMADLAVTTEEAANAIDRMTAAEEKRQETITKFSDDVASAAKEGVSSLDFLKGATARTNIAINTVNEQIVNNAEAINETLKTGYQFATRDAYTGEVAYRDYTIEEMMMAAGSLGSKPANMPIDEWLMTAPENQGWRDAMVYQGLDPAQVAKTVAGDNRWGVNSQLQDMVIGEMMTGTDVLDAGGRDALNRSFLDYKDVASFFASKIATGQDADINDYLVESGQTYVDEYGNVVDITEKNIDEAKAWFEAKYGVDLDKIKMNTESFDDLQGLVFDAAGNVVGGTQELLNNVPTAIETSMGKAVVMTKEEYAKLSDVQKALLAKAGVSVITATEEQAMLYGTAGEAISSAYAQELEQGFADIDMDGIIDAYVIDPLTGQKVKLDVQLIYDLYAGLDGDKENLSFGEYVQSRTGAKGDQEKIDQLLAAESAGTLTADQKKYLAEQRALYAEDYANTQELHGELEEQQKAAAEAAAEATKNATQAGVEAAAPTIQDAVKEGIVLGFGMIHYDAKTGTFHSGRGGTGDIVTGPQAVEAAIGAPQGADTTTWIETDEWGNKWQVTVTSGPNPTYTRTPVPQQPSGPAGQPTGDNRPPAESAPTGSADSGAADTSAPTPKTQSELLVDAGFYPGGAYAQSVDWDGTRSTLYIDDIKIDIQDNGQFQYYQNQTKEIANLIDKVADDPTTNVNEELLYDKYYGKSIDLVDIMEQSQMSLDQTVAAVERDIQAMEDAGMLTAEEADRMRAYVDAEATIIEQNAQDNKKERDAVPDVDPVADAQRGRSFANFGMDPTALAAMFNLLTGGEGSLMSLFGDVSDAANPLISLFGNVADAADPLAALFDGLTGGSASLLALFGNLPGALPVDALFGDVAAGNPYDALFGNVAADNPLTTLFGDALTGISVETLFGGMGDVGMLGNLFGDTGSVDVLSNLFGDLGGGNALTTLFGDATTAASVSNLFGNVGGLDNPLTALFGDLGGDALATASAISSMMTSMGDLTVSSSLSDMLTSVGDLADNPALTDSVGAMFNDLTTADVTDSMTSMMNILAGADGNAAGTTAVLADAFAALTEQTPNLGVLNDALTEVVTPTEAAALGFDAITSASDAAQTVFNALSGTDLPALSVQGDLTKDAVTRLNDSLVKIGLQNPKPKITVFSEQAELSLQRVWDKFQNIKNLNGMVVTLTVTASASGGGDGDADDTGPHAAGGLVRTAFSMVGELGRELVALPMGSRVFSASQTEDILGEAMAPRVNMMTMPLTMPSSLTVETDGPGARHAEGSESFTVNFNGDMQIRSDNDIRLLVDQIDAELGRRNQNARRGQAGTYKSLSVDS